MIGKYALRFLLAILKLLAVEFWVLEKIMNNGLTPCVYIVYIIFGTLAALEPSNAWGQPCII
jgi:hypothetical protein